MELNNTIILPGDNLELSKRLLASLIKEQDVVLVIIFGKDTKAENAVRKADVRANAIVSGITRKVAWMQDVSMLDFLKSLIVSNLVINLSEHIGVAISMTDVLKDLIPIKPAPDFIRMELAFINASKIK